jgi:PAS domain S-box-containing protein
MVDEKLPPFDDPEEEPKKPRNAERLQSTTDITETINFDACLTWEQLTSSASFDLRGIKQATYSKLLQAIPIPVFFVDKSRKITFVNKAFGKIAEDYLDVVGASFSALFYDPWEAKQAVSILDKVLSDRKPKVFEAVLQVGQGKIWGRTHLRSIRLREQQLILAIVEDLTAEKKRVLLNEKYKRLVDLLPIGIVEFDLTRSMSIDVPEQEAIPAILNAKAVDGNPEFARIHGFKRISDLMGSRAGDLLPFEGHNKALYRTWIREGFPISFAETKEPWENGTVRYLENTLIGIVNNNRLLGFWLATRDITGRQCLKEDTLRTQKLESIGILAGGIAHDFNNILTAILGNINLAKIHTRPKTKTYQRLVEAEKGAWRAKELTAQLLTFSKGGLPIKKVWPLGPLLKEATSFALMGSNVGLEFSIAEDLWPVEADEGQIGQVINNIVLNAGQAMPEGGEVHVTARNLVVTGETGLPLNDGKYVKVSITDKGVGIPENYIHRVFDPYFTTKQTGSGLGLATAYSIVKKHGGFVAVESRLSKGTTFNVYLPASEKTIPVEGVPLEEPLYGQGRILLMDDEEMVRDVAAEMLTHMGYEVVTARDGHEAIDLYRKAMEERPLFDAVIMDLTVPGGMGGKEAVKELLKTDPQTKAIVCSGYSNDPIMGRFAEYGFKGVVSKPYDAAQLQRVLREVMAGRPIES